MFPVVTQWSSVLVIAPELANAQSLQSTAAQNLLLSDAAAFLNPSVWGAKLEIGQRYLCAHIATMSLRRGASGQITDVGAGAAKVSYKGQDAQSTADLSFSQTSYGLEYQRIRNTLPAARFAVGGGFGFEQYGGWGGLCSTCGNYPCGC